MILALMGIFMMLNIAEAHEPYRAWSYNEKL